MGEALEVFGWFFSGLICLSLVATTGYFSRKKCPACGARGVRVYEDSFDVEWECPRCPRKWKTV